MIRPTVRLRLTLWYASIFLLGGAVLLAISYVVVSRSTASFPTRVGEQLKANGGVITVAGGPAATVPPGLPATKILLPAGLPASDRRLVLRLEQARTAATLRAAAVMRATGRSARPATIQPASRETSVVAARASAKSVAIWP